MTRFKPTRRKVLQVISVTSLAGCASTADIANAKTTGKLKTPAETEGPFYPPKWEGDIDGNLVQIDQRDAYEHKSSDADKPVAPGTLFILRGQIQRADGKPAANAQIDIWQTDHTGRYRHPDDAGEEPVKRGFQGYGRVRTDAQGRYEFTTVKPARYGSRPPHIHFRIEDGTTTLTSQMYFAGENRESGVLARAGSLFWANDRSLLTLDIVKQANGPAQAEFNVYL